MSVAADFKGDYSPGGLGGRSRRRVLARRAGLASGRRRRELAWTRRGNTGPADPKLKLPYELRQVSRREFDRRYEKAFPRPERPTAAASWERGRETVWEHAAASWRLTCVEGQHCKTTKPQRAAALSSRGRPRCPRTIRRLNLKLERMGLAGFSHWHAPRGRKDCLVLEWRVSRRLPRLDVTPPSGTVNPATPGVHRSSGEGVAPASPADPDPPDGGNDRAPTAPVTEEEGLQARIDFLELKLAMGWGPTSRIQADLRAVRAQATAMRGPVRARGAGSADGCSAR